MMYGFKSRQPHYTENGLAMRFMPFFLCLKTSEYPLVYPLQLFYEEKPPVLDGLFLCLELLDKLFHSLCAITLHLVGNKTINIQCEGGGMVA